jgi:predicted transcriptional regulator
MTDTKALEQAIVDSGLKKSYLAEQAGITIQNLRVKMNNQQEFRASEIKQIAKAIGLTDREMIAIFFADNVGRTETKKQKGG